MHQWTGHHAPIRTPPSFSVDQFLEAATSSYNGPERQFFVTKNWTELVLR